MTSWLELVVIMLCGGVLSLKMLALWSQKRSAARGIINGRLAPNNLSPNSVCSESQNANIEPLAANGVDEWKNLCEAVESLSGRIITLEDNYLHAVFRSPIFGFEDDLEARFDPEAKLIHLRSAGRVGYSDMGSNAKRVETLKSLVE